MAADLGALPATGPTEAAAERSATIVTITGGSGFLGEWLVKAFLDAGYTVRATVRNPDDLGRGLAVLKALPGAAERLTFWKADLLVPDAFDAAVEGATYVVHSASPVALEVVPNPETQLVKPAVEGTKNVFESVVKSTTVKRVVLTSSFRSVFGLGDEFPKGHIYTEEDWNTKSSLENQQGYALSKILAERAAWVYAEQATTWDMVVLNPGLIFGPLLSRHHKEAFSIQLFTQLVTGALPPVQLKWPCVDVRDTANAHVLALSPTVQQGRYLLTSGTLSLKEILNQVRGKIYRPLLPVSVPQPALRLAFNLGLVGNKLSRTDVEHNVNHRILFSSDKALKAGLLPQNVFRPPRETFQDMYASLQGHKLLGKYN